MRANCISLQYGSKLHSPVKESLVEHIDNQYFIIITFLFFSLGKGRKLHGRRRGSHFTFADSPDFASCGDRESVGGPQNPGGSKPRQHMLHASKERCSTDYPKIMSLCVIRASYFMFS